MSKKRTDAELARTQTTQAALVALASHIQTLVADQSLDSRCAAKLVRRLKKEAATLEDSSAGTKASRKMLAMTLDALDTALFDQGAMLLVAANATLRADDVSDGATTQRT
ncbi:hypothetical protein DR64_7900 [Paraburkholderia xenovorans LB400]|uniref:Uncharacterized protein n=1 Tax=Paraburkholderia xenovorans (strain LB400) TaxID=266265 RepID=Q13HJ2_PARXL|nr:hypothetical protein [Paraburkholderia xenovorans]ABE36447.1 hypothetical protein Bxe_C0548 [Paraburkholderia xenovorans LB400]AIP34310.1 hypothetical protein DR64_7900 [Paraburkholderia xenovorans LB400]